MGATVGCCAALRDRSQDLSLVHRSEAWRKPSVINVEDESWELEFHDCEDGEQSACMSRCLSFQSIRPRRLSSGWLPTPDKAYTDFNGHLPHVVPEDDPALLDFPYSAKVPIVLARTRKAWKERLEHPCKLDPRFLEHISSMDDFNELYEWTKPAYVRRMLRAMDGSEADASDLLVNAIECRVIYRTLFHSLRCNLVANDMRVIGRDRQRRPVVYTCTLSQCAPVKDAIQQMLLTLEAAVLLCDQGEIQQVMLIADMRGFSARLFADPFALKALSRSVGTIFADRMHYILIVDFSMLASGVWSLCKPLVSQKTQNKINFCNEASARKIVEERCPQPTCERILSSFDINRDRSSSTEDRRIHAARTSICDVPLGKFTEKHGDAEDLLCRPAS